jgi:hypothetical protein
MLSVLVSERRRSSGAASGAAVTLLGVAQLHLAVDGEQ